MTAITIALFILVALVVLAVLGAGFFLLLVKLGVIVREASRPAHLDTQNYSLRQGHEVGRSDEVRSNEEARR